MPRTAVAVGGPSGAGVGCSACRVARLRSYPIWSVGLRRQACHTSVGGLEAHGSLWATAGGLTNKRGLEGQSPHLRLSPCPGDSAVAEPQDASPACAYAAVLAGPSRHQAVVRGMIVLTLRAAPRFWPVWAYSSAWISALLAVLFARPPDCIQRRDERTADGQPRFGVGLMVGDQALVLPGEAVVTQMDCP